MDALSHLYLPGALAIWGALAFALLALWGYSLALRGDASGRLFARRAYTCFALSLVMAAGVLAVLLLRRDFRIEYVFQYSGLDLPAHYQFAAFWAGQKGSFLVWLLWGALLGLPLARTAGRDEPSVMGFYILTLLGLLFILVRENPFVMLTHAPADGQGLNPLLQDDWMVIHPPIMFVGYALSAVPFAFALAALWRRDTSKWAARAFPWALAGFLVLGTAILMGGYWAYKTLGWGGYWGWDPVENASLIPFLLGTVLIHGLHLERTKGRYRRANLILACLVYLAVLYGTFLTRSGVLADFSVHSFVDLGISGWLIALMGFFLFASVWLLATRLRQVPSAPSEDPILSRGSFMVLGTITVLLVAAVVTLGTSAPLLTRIFPRPGQVGPSFYNRVNLPLAMLIALLLSLVPYLTWRGETWRRLIRQIGFALFAAAVITSGALLAGVRDPFHVAFVLLAALAFATNLQKTIDQARQGSFKGAGGYLAHVGVGMILLGVLASSAYDQSTKVTLELGVAQKVDDLTLTFQRMLPRSGRERERMEIAVRADDGRSYLAHPKLFVNDRTRQLMVNPDVRKQLFQDVYISPIEFDPGRQAGEAARLQLAKSETGSAAGWQVRFLGFDLQAEGNAMTQMASGGPVTVGAVVEVTRDGQTTRALPLYRFRPDGAVEAPPFLLPGGGEMVLSGINASAGAVQLELTGGPADADGVPPRLSIDLTRKPLIKLVWYGLYVVIAGGLLSTIKRFREARKLDRLDTAASA